MAHVVVLNSLATFAYCCSCMNEAKACSIKAKNVSRKETKRNVEAAQCATKRKKNPEQLGG